MKGAHNIIKEEMTLHVFMRSFTFLAQDQSGRLTLALTQSLYGAQYSLYSVCTCIGKELDQVSIKLQNLKEQNN